MLFVTFEGYDTALMCNEDRNKKIVVLNAEHIFKIVLFDNDNDNDFGVVYCEKIEDGICDTQMEYHVTKEEFYNIQMQLTAFHDGGLNGEGIKDE